MHTIFLLYKNPSQDREATFIARDRDLGEQITLYYY